MLSSSRRPSRHKHVVGRLKRATITDEGGRALSEKAGLVHVN